MSCRRHPSSQDCPGVCAACLRERLFDLLGARIQNPSPSTPPRLSPLSGGSCATRRLFFPTPGGSSATRRLFFPTPEAGHAASAGSGGFSLISLLFRHKRFEQEDPDSGSWLRSFIHRKKKPRRLPEAAATIGRGLSPAEREVSDCGSESGDSTASSGAWRMPTPSPMRRAAAAARRQGVSGFGVCLSPLVRASPGRRRSKVSEVGFSGDLRGGSNQQQSQHHRHQLRHVPGGGAAFAANRSRKLADFGRFR